MSTAGKAVFLSALTVVMALAAVFLVPVMVFRSMALGMILSVVAVAAASLTLLPAILVALGDRVLVKKTRTDPDITAESRWTRWTGMALRRPGTILAIGLVVLGAFIAPALGMHLGMPGARVVDTGHTSRDGYDMLVERVRARCGRTRVHHGPRRRREHRHTRRVAGSRRRRRARRHRTGRDRAASSFGSPARRRRLVEDRDDGRHAAEPARCRGPRSTVGGPAAQNRDLTGVLTGRGAVRDRAHPDRRVRAAARRVPQPRRRAHVDPHERAHRRCRVRVRDARVPTRVRHRPARHPAPGVRRRVGATVLLRPAVRPVDGLPAVPARRDPRTLRSHRQHHDKRSPKASPAPADRSPTRRSS